MNDIMLKEILSQPEYVERCLPLLRQNLKSMDLKCKRVIMGGCGDSYFSSVALSELYQKFGIDFISATSQEIEQFITINQNDLVVLASVSGSTKRTLKAAEKANKQNAKTLAITCNPDSSLSKICNHTLVLPYKPITRETPHTLDFTITLLAQVLLIENITGKILTELDKLSETLYETIRYSSEKIQSLCLDIDQEPRFFFLGVGYKSGIAMYGCAKFHEVGGIVAINSEPENFWHGQNFMVRPEDFVILFGNDNEKIEVEEFLIQIFSSITDNVMYIGSNFGESKFNVNPMNSNSVISPFTDAIVPQLLCYYIANALSIQADKPTQRLAVNRNSLKAQSSWFAQKLEAN